MDFIHLLLGIKIFVKFLDKKKRGSNVGNKTGNCGKKGSQYEEG